jgi:hypothetical protein
MGKYIELNQTNMEETIKEGVVFLTSAIRHTNIIRCLKFVFEFQMDL